MAQLTSLSTIATPTGLTGSFSGKEDASGGAGRTIGRITQLSLMATPTGLYGSFADKGGTPVVPDIPTDADWGPVDRDWRKQKKSHRLRRKRISKLFEELTGDRRVPELDEVQELKTELSPVDLSDQMRRINQLEALVNELARIERALREDEDITLLLLM